MNWLSYLTEDKIEGLLVKTTSSLVIILLSLITRAVIFKVVKIAVRRVEDEDPESVNSLEARAQTLASITRSIISVTILVIASLMVLSKWGINIAPILAGAGIFGLAVGFGTQTLVRDVVTGFFILLENQFNVGDKIRIAGLEGRVLEMNLRTTILQGEDGSIYIIPNSRISEITKLKE